MIHVDIRPHQSEVVVAGRRIAMHKSASAVPSRIVALSGAGRPMNRMAELSSSVTTASRQPQAKKAIPTRIGRMPKLHRPKGTASGVPSMDMNSATTSAVPSEANGCWNQGASTEARKAKGRIHRCDQVPVRIM